MTPKHTTIAICSSANFYRQVIDAQEELEALGLAAIVPKTATAMKNSNDFDISHHKTWFANPHDYPKKAELMRAHFDEVVHADAVLVINLEKHGVQNYIGPNVLMEMALAFHLKKPIFVLNDLPKTTAYDEELRGMMPIVLHGKLEDLPAKLQATA